MSIESGIDTQVGGKPVNTLRHRKEEDLWDKYAWAFVIPLNPVNGLEAMAEEPATDEEPARIGPRNDVCTCRTTYCGCGALWG